MLCKNPWHRHIFRMECLLIKFLTCYARHTKIHYLPSTTWFHLEIHSQSRNSRSVEISHPIPPLNGNSHSSSMNFSTFVADGLRQRGQSRESVVMINYEPSISPTIDGPSTSTTQGPHRTSPIPRLNRRAYITHYVDEEGKPKPCTNVWFWFHVFQTNSMYKRQTTLSVQNSRQFYRVIHS